MLGFRFSNVQFPPLFGLDGELKYQIIPYLRQVFAEFSIPHQPQLAGAAPDDD